MNNQNYLLKITNIVIEMFRMLAVAGIFYGLFTHCAIISDRCDGWEGLLSGYIILFFIGVFILTSFARAIFLRILTKRRGENFSKPSSKLGLYVFIVFITVIILSRIPLVRMWVEYIYDLNLIGLLLLFSVVGLSGYLFFRRYSIKN